MAASALDMSLDDVIKTKGGDKRGRGGRTKQAEGSKTSAASAATRAVAAAAKATAMAAKSSAAGGAKGGSQKGKAPATPATTKAKAFAEGPKSTPKGTEDKLSMTLEDMIKRDVQKKPTEKSGKQAPPGQKKTGAAEGGRRTRGGRKMRMKLRKVEAKAAPKAKAKARGRGDDRWSSGDRWGGQETWRRGTMGPPADRWGPGDGPSIKRKAMESWAPRSWEPPSWDEPAPKRMRTVSGDMGPARVVRGRGSMEADFGRAMDRRAPPVMRGDFGDGMSTSSGVGGMRSAWGSSMDGPSSAPRAPTRVLSDGPTLRMMGAGGGAPRSGNAQLSGRDATRDIRGSRGSGAYVIKVCNVPKDLDKRDVKEAFEDNGRVIDCTVERGVAMVTFQNLLDAKKAVQTFDRGELNGQTIFVTLEH